MVAVPPPDIAERLRRLQDELVLNADENVPHITLKMPFQVRTTLAEVRARIAEAARRTRPIRVSIAGVGGFPGPYSNAVYATIHPSPPLLALHTALVEGLGGSVENVLPYTDEIEATGYVPHITVASDLSAEEFARSMARGQDYDVHGRFQIFEIELMRKEAGRRWKRVQTFTLECPLARP